jgi:hypothetical protein
VRVCTTVSRRDLPRARVLADSLAAQHPGGRLHVLVTDDVEHAVDARKEPFDVGRPEDLPLPRLEYARMAALYEPKDLVTAVKFWQIRQLLSTDAVVLFLDSDIELFAPLDGIAELCAAHGSVVTPHSVEPIPLDGETPTELQIQRSGVFNTGFIGVSSAADAFLEWMCARARRDCILDAEAGLWFDQRWFDFVPLFFDAHIARERGYNVAYWNLHEREVAWAGEGYLAGGEPLVFFHFSGFDPHQPQLLTRVATRIRPQPGTPLAQLTAAYAQKLLAHGFDECADVVYGYERIDDRRKWTPELRRVYRDELIAAERGLAPLPPEPGEDGFGQWLDEAVRNVGPPSGLRTEAVRVVRRVRRTLRRAR